MPVLAETGQSTAHHADAPDRLTLHSTIPTRSTALVQLRQFEELRETVEDVAPKRDPIQIVYGTSRSNEVSVASQGPHERSTRTGHSRNGWWCEDRWASRSRATSCLPD